MTERRLFSRIAYKAPAVISANEIAATCQVIDMSLHGICTTNPSLNHDIKSGTVVSIRISIPDSDIVLNVEAQLVAQDDHHYRFRIDQIDIDSITHLKRLIELNTGDETLLHRELQHLSDVLHDK